MRSTTDTSAPWWQTYLMRQHIRQGGLGEGEFRRTKKSRDIVQRKWESREKSISRHRYKSVRRSVRRRGKSIDLSSKSMGYQNVRWWVLPLSGRRRFEAVQTGLTWPRTTVRDWLTGCARLPFLPRARGERVRVLVTGGCGMRWEGLRGPRRPIGGQDFGGNARWLSCLIRLLLSIEYLTPINEKLIFFFFAYLYIHHLICLPMVCICI